jgi:6-pyruvoyl-tetrahydropterin synthase
VQACIIDYIDSAHHLVGHGKCERPHGHTYQVDVTMEITTPLAKEGYFAERQATIHKILDGWDHYDLNLKLDFPTCEHISVGLYHEIKEQIPELLSVKCWEGKYKWSEIHRDDAESSFHPLQAKVSSL